MDFLVAAKKQFVLSGLLTLLIVGFGYAQSLFGQIKVNDSESVRGSVIDKYITHGSRGHTGQAVTYTYSVAGVIEHGRSAVSASTYESAYPGAPITVFYSRSNPAHSFLDRGYQGSSGLFLVHFGLFAGGLSFVFGLIGRLMSQGNQSPSDSA